MLLCLAQLLERNSKVKTSLQFLVAGCGNLNLVQRELLTMMLAFFFSISYGHIASCYSTLSLFYCFLRGVFIDLKTLLISNFTLHVI